MKNDVKTEHIPVVMLTAKGDEADTVAGFELGAEDYVTKPFSPKILIARIRRILHRAVSRDLEKPIIRKHDLTIDPGRHEVLVKGQPVHLTFTEFNILYVLVKRPGLVFTRY